MYVLIKQNSESQIESVEAIGDVNLEGAIQVCDDSIRNELRRCEYDGDVDYTPNMGPEDQPNWIGTWAIDDAVWELWMI